MYQVGVAPSPLFGPKSNYRKTRVIKEKDFQIIYYQISGH